MGLPCMGLGDRGGTSPRMRVHYEALSKAYLRVAEQVDRNDMTYEPPPKLSGPGQKNPR